MTTTSLKQQMVNYSLLFRQLIGDYYQQQKKAFWLVQLLMVVSTLTGLVWILTILLGISHYHNPTETQGIKYLLFSWVFAMPIWQWLFIASAAGMVSAWSLYGSITTGVQSVLAYQKQLAYRCLHLVSQDRYQHWTAEFDQPARQVLLRILRQGVQLSGLVARRITRAFVSLVTFVLAFMVLLYLDSKLLLLILPLSVLYVIALYYINRHAARVSTAMADGMLPSVMRFNALVAKVLNGTSTINSQTFNQQFDESLYMQQAQLKYQRRLAEIHVNWLNTLFLVIGIALIIIYIVYIQASTTIDWQHLLFFLIALRYAASSLQQISATTVAFSRFLPEIQLVYRLLNCVHNTTSVEKIKLTEHAFIYMPSSNLDAFEKRQLKGVFSYSNDAHILSIKDLRDKGVQSYFKQLKNSAVQVLIVDNNLNRIKTCLRTHKSLITPQFNQFILFNARVDQVKQLTIKQILALTTDDDGNDLELDIDILE